MSHKSRLKRNRVRSGNKPTQSKSTVKGSAEKPRTSSQEIAELLHWLLPAETCFSSIKRHGNTSWQPRVLARLGLCWAWAENRNLTDSFTYAARWLKLLMPKDVLLTTYQGMMNALQRWTPALLLILQRHFQKLMKEIGGQYWTVGGWVPIAFDGSRDEAPRTKSNERAYSAPNHGKGKAARSKRNRNGSLKKRTRTQPAQPPAPHVWMTLLWHVGLQLPWTWRLGRSNTSERAHVMEMLETEDFPKNTLFCGDAGFVGYEFWSSILQHNRHFLVRVGGNVKLLQERGHSVLKENMTVLSWPKTAVKAEHPPLRLRLVYVKVGKTKMWLLTSVTDESKLSLSQIRDLYEKRWGIEVEFRGLKQTLDKGKLRCRNSSRVAVELNWSFIAMTAVELCAMKEQLSEPRDAPALRESSNTLPVISRSLASSVRAIRSALASLNAPSFHSQSLSDQLKSAVVSRSHADPKRKQCRYRPPNTDHNRPLGSPQLRQLQKDEKQKLRRLRPACFTP